MTWKNVLKFIISDSDTVKYIMYDYNEGLLYSIK